MQPFDQSLVELAIAAHTGSPPSPHKPFVARLVSDVRAATGRFFAESWYRRLLVASGVPRRPSVRTFLAVLSSARDQAGEGRGPTQTTVRLLERRFSRIEAMVVSINKTVTDLAAVVDRQLEISRSLERQRMQFTDDGQVYQRRIEALATLISENAAASNATIRAANDAILTSARTIATLQQSLRDRL